jgi:hypothetical protein
MAAAAAAAASYIPSGPSPSPAVRSEAARLERLLRGSARLREEKSACLEFLRRATDAVLMNGDSLSAGCEIEAQEELEERRWSRGRRTEEVRLSSYYKATRRGAGAGAGDLEWEYDDEEKSLRIAPSEAGSSLELERLQDERQELVRRLVHQEARCSAASIYDDASSASSSSSSSGHGDRYQSAAATLDLSNCPEDRLCEILESGPKRKRPTPTSTGVRKG